MRGDHPGLHLIVKTETETVEVHACPLRFMTELEFAVEKGDTVTVLGSRPGGDGHRGRPRDHEGPDEPDPARQDRRPGLDRPLTPPRARGRAAAREGAAGRGMSHGHGRAID